MPRLAGHGCGWPGDFSPEAGVRLLWSVRSQAGLSPQPRLLSAKALCPFLPLVLCCPLLKPKHQGSRRTWHLSAWRSDLIHNVSDGYASAVFMLASKPNFNFTLPGVNSMRKCRVGHHAYPVSLLKRNQNLGFPSPHL